MAQSEAVPSAPASSARIHIQLGDVLRQENLITQKDLKQAFARQKAERKQKKTPKTLAQTLVDIGVITQEEILKAFNRRYQSNFTSLSGDLENYLSSAGIESGHQRSGRRMPIKIKLSIGVIGILWLTILVLSVVILNRQTDLLYNQTLKVGKVSLNSITSTSGIPLLNGDVLRLNALVGNATSVEGILYALIQDRKGIIQAHTDPSKIRKERKLEMQSRTETQKEENYEYFNYINPAGAEVLEITSPVSFKKKELGRVSIGISLDFISDQISQETFYIMMLSLFIICAGVLVSIIMGASFSRPISELVIASREIGLGNLQYKISKIRNDELGDLANAFNFMSSELVQKAMIQDSFGKYVGSGVLDMIMADPDSAFLKGKRSNVSVMFTDVRGFTSFSENREPEEVVEALNEYFDISTRKIQEFGGYVDKFIGDAVMGVFGIPVYNEKHPEQSVRAAVAIQKELITAADRSGNEMLRNVGIGINSGFVVSGNIGSQGKLEYTVIGDAVNVASRLNGLAKSGETVISKSVLDALPKKILNAEKMPPQAVKGKSEKLEVFKILDLK